MGDKSGFLRNLIRAWHGSSEDFDKFTLNKARRNSGDTPRPAGHGIYFSGDRDLAEEYIQDKIGTGGYLTYADDQLLPKRFTEWDPSIKAAKRMSDFKLSPLEAKEWLMKRNFTDVPEFKVLEKWERTPPERYPVFREEPQMATPGKLYEVDLDADPRRMLNQYETLKNQSSDIKDLLTDLFRSRPSDMMASDFYASLGSGPQASKILKDRGVEGALGGLKGPNGRDYSEYVMFDPRRIAIRNKYAEGGYIRSFQ